jgi:hypothetical protein
MSSAQKRISIELLLPQIELFKGREGDVARDQVLLFIDSPSEKLKTTDTYFRFRNLTSK